jgi:hypothetical protein
MIRCTRTRSRNKTSVLVIAGLLLSGLPASCYLMPDFEHRHITWTAHGPFGLGDMEGTTYFYFGYHIQFSLPGTAATWFWLGPVLLVAALATFIMVMRRFIRWRKARQAAHSHAHNVA